MATTIFVGVEIDHETSQPLVYVKQLLPLNQSSTDFTVNSNGLLLTNAEFSTLLLQLNGLENVFLRQACKVKLDPASEFIEEDKKIKKTGIKRLREPNIKDNKENQ